MAMSDSRYVVTAWPWVLGLALVGCDPSRSGPPTGAATTGDVATSSADAGPAPATSPSGGSPNDPTATSYAPESSGTGSDATTTSGGASETTGEHPPPDGTTTSSSGLGSSGSSGSSDSSPEESSSSTGEAIDAEPWTFALPLDVTPRYLERLGDDSIVVVAEDLEAERVVVIGLDDAGEEQFEHQFEGFEGQIWGSEPQGDWGQTEFYTPRLVSSSAVRGVDELLLVVASTVYSFDPAFGTLLETPLSGGGIPLPGGGYASLEVELVAAGPDGRVATRGHNWWADFAIFSYDPMLQVDFIRDEWGSGFVELGQQVIRTSASGYVLSGGTDLYGQGKSNGGIQAYDPDAQYSVLAGVPLVHTSWEGGFMHSAFSCMAELNDGTIAVVRGYADIDGGVDPAWTAFERWTIDDTLLSSSPLPIDAWGTTCAPAVDASGTYIAVQDQLVHMTQDGVPSIVADEATGTFIDVALAPGNLKVVLDEGADGTGVVRALSIGS